MGVYTNWEFYSYCDFFFLVLVTNNIILLRLCYVCAQLCLSLWYSILLCHDHKGCSKARDLPLPFTTDSILSSTAFLPTSLSYTQHLGVLYYPDSYLLQIDCVRRYQTHSMGKSQYLISLTILCYIYRQEPSITILWDTPQNNYQIRCWDSQSSIKQSLGSLMEEWGEGQNSIEGTRMPQKHSQLT